MRHSELDVIRERLQQRLGELTKRAGKIENDLRQPLNPDWEDRITERENDEVLESLDASTLDEAGQIQEALDRMNAGTYGICLTCGKPVGEKRLEAVPHAATCVGCAS
ncbi:MAG: TraR/DksA C4-type zinc finger protein [Acidobacteria bacterium]|nr:TraR/DksA C4-type zinc finger protein [Acidobacteriota bacterium]